jgi:hypothetical protein
MTTLLRRRLFAMLLSLAAGCTNLVAEPDAGADDAGSCARACAASELCRSGRCEAVCTVGGEAFDAGTLDAANACAACDPLRSSSGWSPRPDGTGCDAGVCGGGVCAAQCFIGGTLHAAGALDADNPCQRCEPAQSTSAWSPLLNGASCGTGEVCEGGACSAQCFIDGGFYASSSANPTNACEQCTPSSSATAWSPRAAGTSCGAGQICEASACVAKCFIGGALYAAAAVNPGNVCQQCDPATSTTDWSTHADGQTCEAGKLCAGGSCVAKCFISGALFDAGVVNPASLCLTCSPPASTAAWTSRGSVLLLEGGTEVASQGWSVTSQAPATLSYLPDSVRLQTSTAPGALTGGQLLLVKAGAVEAGQPFTLQIEALVEAVNAHNQFDSAAAILGSFTPPYGLGNERPKMIYLDSASIGWADDSQAAPFVLDGGFHTYQLAVDAAGTAIVSVDGVSKLVRGSFTTTGTIAIGDQTNDSNVDATLRLRKVTRVCP